jgi:CRISPR system Cascade subunit CasA
MSAFSLVHGAWIPVRLADGTVKSIAPFEITSEHSTNPVIAFAWPRPDFDLASHELLIGLLAAIYPAATHKDWIKLFHEPPAPAVLEAAFEPFADAFLLDGSGPRFLQDFDALDGEDSPIDALFIDAPGANTIKLNKDLFIKRGQSRVLSRAASAMALYTLQQFAPSGGAGHRTSLRGGGPLVTLALPDGGPGSRPTLWQRLWLNTPSDLRLTPPEQAQAFPWLAATRTSAKKEVVHSKDPDVHGLQCLFGMPRRIRLIFKDNIEKRPCDLTGEIDEIVCTGFVAAPWGINYGFWQHPASPYYTPKANSNDPPLPVHAPEGRLGYRQWLGFVFEGEGKIPAAAITTAQRRLVDLEEPWESSSRLLAGGYAMDNMKALAFAEAEMPLHQLDPALTKQIEICARLMVNAASVAASMLGISVKRALYGDKADIKFDSTPLDTARERLWETTETGFHKTLDEAIKQTDGNAQEKLKQMWRLSLERTALAIFDDTVPIESFDIFKVSRQNENKNNIVEGRKQLVFSLKGYGKLGAEFFKALRLDPPEQKKKSSAAPDGKSKEDISQ